MLGLNSIYQTLGTLARGQQQYDTAITAFSHRIDLVPNDADAHQELGEMYFRQSRHTEALAEFTVTLIVNPKTPRCTGRHRAGPSAQRELCRRRSGGAPGRGTRRVTQGGEIRPRDVALIRLGSVDEGKRELEVYQRLQTEATAAQSRRLEVEGFRRDAALSIIGGGV
jgi:tetratricopeptide (TPR) repeat protein